MPPPLKLKNGSLLLSPDPNRKLPGAKELVSLSGAIREVVSPIELAEFWHQILVSPISTTAEKMAAARELADRGWGKAPAHVVVSQQGSQTLDLGQLSREELKLLQETIKGELSGNRSQVASLGDFETSDSPARVPDRAATDHDPEH